MTWRVTSALLAAALLPSVITFGGATPIFTYDNSLFSELTEDENRQGNEWEKSGYFEGDIMINAFVRNGRLCDDADCRWHDRIVPYKIDAEFDKDQVEAIHDAFKEYHTRTCIRFRPANESDIDYVKIVVGLGCSSYVGRQGGPQQLHLKPNEPGNGCFKHGTIVHELLHSLGFYHQQSAADRDDYVKIVWNNIRDGHQHNFRKYPANKVTSYGIKYDYDSVMHYSSYAFSKNGKKTIVALDDTANIGQRDELSDKDIKKLHLMYGCSEPTESEER